MDTAALQFKMQMRPCRGTCRAHSGDPVAHLDRLPFFYIQLAAVGVKRLDPIPVVQLSVLAVGVVLSNVLHSAIRKSPNRVPLLAADVYSAMKRVLPVDGMVPVAVAGVHCSR